MKSYSHDGSEPGGYLQWNEVDTSSRRTIRPEDGTVPTPAIDELEAYLRRRRAGHPPELVPLFGERSPPAVLIQWQLAC